MQSRPKTFLTFAVICIVPFLIVAILSFAGNLRVAESQVQVNLEEKWSSTRDNFDALLRERQMELRNLANSSSLRRYVDEVNNPSTTRDVPPEIREAVVPLLYNRQPFGTLAVFSKNKGLLFVAEPESSGGVVDFQTENFSPAQLRRNDAAAPIVREGPVHCRLVSEAPLGSALRCGIPISGSEDRANTLGTLVADVNIDSLLARTNRNPSNDQMVVILDDSSTIVTHTNDALKHQQVNNSIPYFSPVANSMTAGQSGNSFFKSSSGDEWLASYGPLLPPKLSLAVARNYSQATRTTRMFGWLAILAALLLGLGAAALLSTIYLKQTKSISAVAQGANAIAQGKLDHRIDLRSSDNLRPIADNLGLVTKQLRDQLAREAESRQFQSFVRLSAVLTHDLKNAIGTLSMLVTNMERHADNPEFRADAMTSLTSTTEKLNSLVARLSNPGSTFSGEHKLPRAVDIIPMLKRVVSLTAEPLRKQHDIVLKLPESLYALVDIERMDKVLENLIINAIEALDAKRGRLTIGAGHTNKGQIYFSVSDDGPGMSPRFVEERLFHPFATTKRTGVGLGLYTCREVVRANGGSIEVESEEGAGTTFRVVLPSPPIKDAARKSTRPSHS